VVAIREEGSDDVSAVRAVSEQAFGQAFEADLVDAIRARDLGALSLVAEDAGRVVGHILFTPVSVEAGRRSVAGMGLGPMSVVPHRQREGIGSALVMHGLDILQRGGCPFVVVLGHAAYYPRFGFERASHYGVTSQWADVPDDAFMLLAFDLTSLEGAAGVARYSDEFDSAASS